VPDGAGTGPAAAPEVMQGGGQALVREMREADIPAADRVVRRAFGTFLGMPEPEHCFAGQDYVRTRFFADPQSAFVALRSGVVVGSNFATCWGSVGFFGPLSVDPGAWDGGIGKCLMAPVLARFDAAGVRHAGLFTFPHSVKHVALYRRFGFWPRALTFIVGRMPSGIGSFCGLALSALRPAEQREALGEIAALSGSLFAGFDPTPEVRAIAAQGLGETILLTGTGGLEGFAACHLGDGTEAGPGNCYVKIAAVHGGSGAPLRLERLVAAVEGYAHARGIVHVSAGVSSARTGACRVLLRRGYRVLLQGVAMHRPNSGPLARPGVYLLDDWR
jgi:predicted N-acetyltransferase YhbS